KVKKRDVIVKCMYMYFVISVSFSSTHWRMQECIKHGDVDGELKGFDLDLSNAVCRVAGKKCTYIYRICNSNSADGKFLPGKALETGEVDGCLGNVITPEREEVFDFSRAYFKTSSNFFVPPGNPRGFSPENIEGKRIVFFNATYTNMDCLKRLGLNGAVPLVESGSLSDVKTKVLEGNADALFAPRTTIPGVERVPGQYNCASGAGVMVLKGNADIPTWWNRAFQIVVESGEYKRICDSVAIKYGGYPVRCFDFQTNVIG
ncbi:unnamed protein product, partial [Owenia fusiformis]